MRPHRHRSLLQLPLKLPELLLRCGQLALQLLHCLIARERRLLLLELPQHVLQDSTAALQAGGLQAGLAALQQGVFGAAAAVGGSSGGWSLTNSGEFWMLLAAQSMAVGTVMVR